MFTDNELRILKYLKAHPDVDFRMIVENCRLPRSSTHAALRHLLDRGVVTVRSRSHDSRYQLATRDVIEQLGARLLADFRNVLLPDTSSTAKPRLVFVDNYSLSDSQLHELRNRYDIHTLSLIHI